MLTTDTQNEFDYAIGKLDRTLSVLITYAESKANLDEPNRQTLESHAKDMIEAGNKIIKLLHSEVFTDPDDGLVNFDDDEPIDTTRLDKSLKGTKKKRSVIEEGRTEVEDLVHFDRLPTDDDDTPSAAELFMDQVGFDIKESRHMLERIYEALTRTK